MGSPYLFQRKHKTTLPGSRVSTQITTDQPDINLEEWQTVGQDGNQVGLGALTFAEEKVQNIATQSTHLLYER